MHTPAIRPETIQVFRPDVFFEGAWRAWGLVKDLSGKVVDRFEAQGEGRVQPLARVFEIDEAYAFSSGREDTLSWRLSTDDLGVFSGVEAGSGARGMGRTDRHGYSWAFVRKTPTALGLRSIRMHARYHQLSDEDALCVTSLRLAGLPIATMSSVYRRK